MNSLEDLRDNASTPDTRIIHSSENDTNTGVQESTTGHLTLELDSDLRGITVSDLFDEEDRLLHNAQNTQVSGISDESTVPPNTLPPNRHLNRTNEDILGLERIESKLKSKPTKRNGKQ